MREIPKRLLRKLLTAANAHGTQEGIWIGECTAIDGEKHTLKLRPTISRIQFECTEGCELGGILNALGLEDSEAFRAKPVPWEVSRRRALERIKERYKGK